MKMCLRISGTFHIAGPSPGGHPLLFKAHDPGAWNNQAGAPAAPDPQGLVPLRLEGIDLLEIDFQGRHQPLKYAQEALDLLLSRLGIRGNLFGPSHAREGVAGLIAARGTERPGGPVALVFRGGSGLPEGKEVLVTPPLLKKSVNYQLLAAGLAYPTYYEGLSGELREELTRACRAARDQGLGFWPLDRTNLGVDLDRFQDLTKKFVIFPKLFRRLAQYLFGQNGPGQGAGGRRPLRGFMEYLAGRGDAVIHLPTGRLTTLAELVAVTGDSLRLTAAPEDLVFKEIAAGF
jgi:hypothetical protein